LAESGEIALRQQPDGDLGKRMRQAVEANSGAAGTLVIGTDCPLLTPADLCAAGEALATHDAVVTPAEDGGYVLIGVRRAIPEVFANIDWSTDRVMAQTRQRLTGNASSWFEFSPFWDVDRSTDFERLLPLFPELQDCIRPGEIA
jgi:rSAM/selenodomain-associated transferase 1